jgi:hypothetical protein
MGNRLNIEWDQITVQQWLQIESHTVRIARLHVNLPNKNEQTASVNQELPRVSINYDFIRAWRLCEGKFNPDTGRKIKANGETWSKLTKRHEQECAKCASGLLPCNFCKCTQKTVDGYCVECIGKIKYYTREKVDKIKNSKEEDRLVLLWRMNKLVNPKTNKPIQPYKGIWNKYNKLSEERTILSQEKYCGNCSITLPFIDSVCIKCQSL